MKRILHIGMSNTLGGIEVFIMNLYRKIDKNKIQFDFISFSQSIPFEEEIKSLGGRIFHITPRKENYIKNRNELSNFFKEHPEYKIVHSHLNSCSYIEPVKIAKQHGLRVIVHSHNSGLKGNIITRSLHKYNKLFLSRYADLKFSCSVEAGSFMFHGMQDEIKIIPNAIDGEKFKYRPDIKANVRKELNIEDEFVLGTVGRLTTQKNHKFMLEILSKLIEYQPKAKLLIAGNGPLTDELLQYANELRLSDNVIFLGAITNPERIVQAMDVFIMPSFYEGLSISALEAHASGLVVVASEFVPTSTYIQFLVEKISLSESAATWAKLINNIDVPDRHLYYSDFEKSQYNINNRVDQMMKIYNDI